LFVVSLGKCDFFYIVMKMIYVIIYYMVILRIYKKRLRPTSSWLDKTILACKKKRLFLHNNLD